MKSTGIEVVGCGIVTPFAAGSGVEILSRGSGARCQPGCKYWSVPDEVCATEESFGPEVKRDKASMIASLALSLALKDAGIDLSVYEPARIGLVLGCGFAGQLGMIAFAEEVRSQSDRFVSPIHFPQTVGNYVAGVMSRSFGIQGPNLTVATGASSGLNAVIKACAILDDASADIAIAGGYETLSEDLVKGLDGPGKGRGNAEVWSEGACLYILRRLDDSEDSSHRAVIRDWSSPHVDGASGDDFSVADVVGHSFAAESAMRLAAAIVAPRDGRRRVVVQTSDGNQTLNLTVEV